MWRNVGQHGKLTKDIATNLQSGNREPDTTWDGNAADAAYVYFEELAKKIGRLDADLKELQGYYKDVALAVARAADLIKGLLEQLADEAIIAEAELAAGTLLAETGVGAIAGYAAAALEITEMIKTWGRITEAYSAVQQAVDVSTTAAGAVIGGLGAALKSLLSLGRATTIPRCSRCQLRSQASSVSRRQTPAPARLPRTIHFRIVPTRVPDTALVIMATCIPLRGNIPVAANDIPNATTSQPRKNAASHRVVSPKPTRTYQSPACCTETLLPGFTDARMLA